MRTARVVIHQRESFGTRYRITACGKNRERAPARRNRAMPVLACEKRGTSGVFWRITLSERGLLQTATDATESKQATPWESVGVSRGGNEVLATDTGGDAEKKGTTEDAKDRDECVDDAQRSGSSAAMNDLGRSPCAIAGSDEPLLVWPSWSLDKPSGDVNLTGSDGLDESAFTPNLQRISLHQGAQGNGKLRSKLARTSRCARITLAAS